MTSNVSSRRPQPRSSMRSASQNVHEVGVGRDVRAVDLDVVGGVGDDDEVVADDVEHPARELRAAGAAGEDDDRPARRSAQRRLGQAGDPDARVGLVAAVDRRSAARSAARRCAPSPGGPASTQRRPSIALDELRDALACRRACGRRRRARPRRARGRGRASIAALTVCSALTTRTPSGTISCACWAAEPCQTPSVRVALPLTAAASGTVASTSSWPSRSDGLAGCEVSDWLRNGTRGRRPRRAAAASAFSSPSNAPPGTCARGALGGLRRRGPRRASRSTTGTPARPRRTARPKPRAPVAPMIETGSGVTGGGV